MKAVILAGGYATRLRPISYALPKLLFPVLGKPMIYWTLDLLKGIGVGEVVLAVNYLADSLRMEVGSDYNGINIKYSLEKAPLGTGGPIKLASEDTRFDETFIVTNGDVIAEIDLAKMLNHHEQTGAMITDALHQVKDPTRFGVAQLDGEGRIRRFVEKPKAKEARSRLINAGIYVVEPDVLQMIPANRKVSMEREIFPVLVNEGKLSGFPFSGDWFDIGSLSDYQRANFSLLQKHAQPLTSRSREIKLARGAVVRAPVILGEGSRLESLASVGPRVVAGKHELIESGARVSNSILFDDVSIGEGSVVSGAILASGVKVGRGVRIATGSIISPHVQIRDGVKIGRNAIIHPYKEIEASIRPGTNAM
ncbi:MAG: NDP-sugar synthase [Candidatus Bathyarchaeia archaeon]|jgi:NDP-sugar pyrophosphorylase family protein